jgi:hypothetical protein
MTDMAPREQNRLSRLSGRSSVHGTAQRILGERVRERKRLWRTPTFWVIALLAFLALLVMLLTACGREANPETTPVSSTPALTTSPSAEATPTPATPGTTPQATAGTSTGPDSGEGDDEPGSGWLAPWGSVTPDGLRYGFADLSGNVVIPATYAHVRPFTAQGLAVVTDMEDNSAVVDLSGRVVIPLQQAYMDVGDEGPILVFRYGDEASFSETAVCDRSGKLLFTTTGSLSRFSEGLAALYQEGRTGYVDLAGNWVIQLDHEVLNDFTDGVALVAKTHDGPRYYIDKTGADMTASLSGGISLYKDTATGRYGYRKPDGSLLTEPLYLEAEPFRDGTAIVSVNADPDGYAGLYGLLDTSGRWVIEPLHSGIRRMRNGLFAVGEPLAKPSWHYEPYMDYTYMGIYGADGRMRVDHVLVSVGDADDRLVSVSDGQRVWLVDGSGRETEKIASIPGSGSVRRIGDLLWGTIDGMPSLYRTDGTAVAILRTGTDLGDGLSLISAKAQGNRYTRLMYPVLRGVANPELLARINALITGEMGTGLTDEPELDEETGERYIETMEGDWQGWRVGRVLVVEQYPYWYPLGAAHGMPGILTLHLNLDTGVKIDLTDLLAADKVPQALRFLSDRVTEIIQRDMEEIGYFVEGVVVTPEQAFRITSGGLELYWAPYELASYAAGFREFLIPWKDLLPFVDQDAEAYKALQLP